jgi:hypothetical protein
MRLKKKETVTAQKKAGIKGAKADVARSYNRFKTFGSRAYTGMSVGRSHKWYYDKGVWRETKISPDLWGISYVVTKRRAGQAPSGSGASIGTDYHWVILAHQHVEKLNADDYSTMMTGLKFKLAHRGGTSTKWNISGSSQRRHLITFLEEMIAQLKQTPIKLEITLGDQVHEVEAIPVLQACLEGVCNVYDVSMDNQQLGLLRRLKSGWKLDTVEDPKLVRALGKALDAYLEEEEAENVAAPLQDNGGKNKQQPSEKALIEEGNDQP